MHKLVFGYGHRTTAELYEAIAANVNSEEGFRLLKVAETTGLPVGNGGINEMIELIKDRMDCSYTEAPAIAIIHEKQIEEGWFSKDLYREFTAVFAYSGDKETGRRVIRLLAPRCDDAGDWAMVGGRWSGFLTPTQSTAISPMFVTSTDPKYIELFGGTPVSDTQRDTLLFKDIDWDKVAEKLYGTPEEIAKKIDVKVQLREKYGLKSIEELFEENFGAQLRDLPEDERAAFRQKCQSALWDLFFVQRGKIDREELAGEGFGEALLLGYSREKLEQFFAVRHFFAAGVLESKVYHDGDIDLSVEPPITIDSLIELGNRLKKSDGLTIVTVIDLHY